MTRNLSILIFNDLAISIKNKSIFLVFFIPIFVFIAMSFIDNVDGNAVKIRIGLVAGTHYEPEIVESITAAGDAFHVVWVDNKQSGVTLLNNHALDGVLIDSQKLPGNLVLLVSSKESPQALAIVETLSALQKVAEGGHAGWITDIEPLHTGGIQRQTLPTWILMLVLLVAFIIMPAQVAEEKEKKLLLALLQTPVSEVEWLIAKLITGMVLILAAVLLLHLLVQFVPDNLFHYLAFIVAGSFCFCAVGIFLGMLCRNQASARTLGMIFYLPMLLPSALSDVSQKLTMVAPFLPSYQFYVPIRSVLLDSGNMSGLLLDWLYLLVLGVLMIYLSHFLIKKRWLM
jgi:ABC-2 type transport system permease protein